jgi:hypothetical protein
VHLFGLQTKNRQNACHTFASVPKIAALPHETARFLSSAKFDEQIYFDN